MFNKTKTMKLNGNAYCGCIDTSSLIQSCCSEEFHRFLISNLTKSIRIFSWYLRSLPCSVDVHVDQFLDFNVLCTVVCLYFVFFNSHGVVFLLIYAFEYQSCLFSNKTLLTLTLSNTISCFAVTLQFQVKNGLSTHN